MWTALESRTLFSASLINGVLRVDGTDRADRITVSQQDPALVVDVNGTVSKFPAAMVRSIKVQAKAGADVVRISQRVHINAKLFGGPGPDKLYGGGGNDTLNGGPNDLLDLKSRAAGLAADVLSGGGGNDTADYSDRAEALVLTLPEPGTLATSDDGIPESRDPDFGTIIPGEHDTILSDVENIVGGHGNDTIVGNARANRLYGGPGDDSLDGGLGSDMLSGGPGIDGVGYGSRTETLRLSLDGLRNDGAAGENDLILNDVEGITGGMGNDTLIGNDGPNFLSGGDGDDTLFGLGGDDRLDGGFGRDTLHGGAGNDYLVGYGGLYQVLQPDDEIDKIFGDEGIDRALVDPLDVVSTVENVTRLNALSQSPFDG